jgi:TM2 domain-containing membrane protein YozV
MLQYILYKYNFKYKMQTENNNSQDLNLQYMHNDSNTKTKLNPEWIITTILVIFFGYFGVHRFYNGKIGTGILMIITVGGLGIWVLIDFIMILLSKFKDSQNKYIKIEIPA